MSENYVIHVCLPVTFFYIQARRFLACLYTRSIFQHGIWFFYLYMNLHQPSLEFLITTTYSGWPVYLHPLIVTLGNVGWMGMVVYWIVIMCSITCAISKSQVKIRGFIIRTSLLPKIVSFYFHFEKMIISIDQTIVHVWLQHMWCVVTRLSVYWRFLQLDDRGSSVFLIFLIDIIYIIERNGI